MSAISSSRPRGAAIALAQTLPKPFLLAASSIDDDAERLSDAITFQVAREFNSAAFQQAKLVGTEE